MKLSRPITKSELIQLLATLDGFIEETPDSSFKNDAVSALRKFEHLQSDLTPNEISVVMQALQMDLSVHEEVLSGSRPRKRRLKSEQIVRDIRALLHKLRSASFD